MWSGILHASTLYGVEWYCNREYPKSRNSVTDKQTDGKPPIRVLKWPEYSTFGPEHASKPFLDRLCSFRSALKRIYKHEITENRPKSQDSDRPIILYTNFLRFVHCGGSGLEGVSGSTVWTAHFSNQSNPLF